MECARGSSADNSHDQNLMIKNALQPRSSNQDRNLDDQGFDPGDRRFHRRVCHREFGPGSKFSRESGLGTVFPNLVLQKLGPGHGESVWGVRVTRWPSLFGFQALARVVAAKPIRLTQSSFVLPAHTVNHGSTA